MFEETESGDWTFMHHPFTSPTPEWRERFADDKGAALSDAYDMVINGNEVMSGSVRIHDADLQERVFETLGMSREEARERFGFFLEAFAYGPPPHAGAALGWDRLSALLTGVESIREVIAFPKTGAGFDPLTGAPTPITDAQRAEAGIDAKPEEPRAAGGAGRPGTHEPDALRERRKPLAGLPVAADHPRPWSSRWSSNRIRTRIRRTASASAGSCATSCGRSTSTR